MREIQIPEEKIKIGKAQLETAVSSNDGVLLSHCKNKRPKYGVVTSYGIEWRTFNDLLKDAEEVCHYFYQLVIFMSKDLVIAPSHADEVYNMHIHPWTGEKLS